MLGGRQSAILAHAAHELTHKLRNALRIFAEGPRVDNGIAGIIVYIRVRRIDPMNADGARFDRGDLAHGVSVFQISASRERHSGWKRSAFIQSHRRPALEIRANQQRQFRFGLELIVEHGRWISLTLHDAERRAMCNVDETSDVEVGHVMHDLLVGRRVRGRQASMIRGEKKLPDFLVHGHFAQRGFHPLLRGGRQLSRRALWGNCAFLGGGFFC